MRFGSTLKRTILYSVTLLSSAAILSLLVVLYSEFGLKSTVKLINYLYYEQIEITGARGTLSEEIKLDKIRISSASKEIVLFDTSIYLALEELIKNDFLHAYSITADKIAILDKNTATQYDNSLLDSFNAFVDQIKEGQTLPEIQFEDYYVPFKVLINKLKLNNIKYITKQAEYNLDYISSDISYHNNVWSIHSFNIKSDNFNILSSGKLVTSTNELAFNLNLYSNQQANSITGNLEAKFDFATNKNSFRLDKISGDWLKSNYVLNGTAEFEKNLLSKLELSAEFAENNFNFIAKLQNDINLTWNLNAPNLTAINKNYAGKINFFGRIVKNNEQDILDVKLLANELQNFRVTKPTEIITEDGISVENLPVLNKVNFTLNGSTQNFEGESRLSLENLSLNTSFFGKAAGNETLLTFTEGKILLEDVTYLTITPDSQIKVSNDKLQLDSLCFATKDSSACLKGEINSKLDWQIKVIGNNINLHLLDNFYPINLESEGLLNCTISSKGSLANFANYIDNLVVQAKVDNYIIHYNDITNDEIKFKIKNLDLNLDFADRVRSKLNIILNSTNKISAEFNIEQEHGLSRYFNNAIEGKLQIDLPELSKLADSTKNKIKGGSLHSTISVSGTLQDPIFANTSNFKNIILYVDSLNTELKLSNLNITQSKTNKSTVTGKGYLGEGPLAIDGEIYYSLTKPSITLNINGDEVTIIDNIEYSIKLSPELKLHLTKNNIDLTGKLKIPQANINIINENDSISASTDVKFITNDIVKSILQKSLDLDIELGDKVYFSGYGLSSKLGGKLKIDLENNSFTKANGELNLEDGTYVLYSLEFKLTNSRLLFAGSSIYNPNLDIKAERTIDNNKVIDNPLLRSSDKIHVGANLTGTLYNPKVQLFSTQGLSENDIISYLTIGKSVDDISKNKTSALFSYILSLFSKEINRNKEDDDNFVDSIELVPTDEVDAAQPESNNEDLNSILANTSIIFGKKLYDRVNLNLEVGLNDPANKTKAKLKYDINDYFTLQVSGSSDVNIGVDLLFDVET